MVILSVVWLFLLAGALNQVGSHQINRQLIAFANLLVGAIYPVFWLEGILRLTWLERGYYNKRRAMFVIIVALVPALRMMLCPVTAQRNLWIPFMGWQRRREALHRRLGRLLSAPMIIFGLMILPVLAMNFIWQKQMDDHPMLGLAVDIAARVIWLAFAIELVVMLASSRKKLSYAIKHWIDVVIVLLPLIAFLRVLQVLRLGSVVHASRLAQMTQVYRVRALALRAWRALLLVEGLDRLHSRSAERRLNHLRGSLNKKMEEAEELR
ncbi:MAG: hypothetical protein ACYTF0_07530, partial [Planctomycetota bacterium]